MQFCFIILMKSYLLYLGYDLAVLILFNNLIDLTKILGVTMLKRNVYLTLYFILYLNLLIYLFLKWEKVLLRKYNLFQK